ncbi:MAG: hypothetical protein KDA51_06830 [Planctomycetales bacterium]|nr:hypothetical protein [Planctomycetales bacterium]
MATKKQWSVILSVAVASSLARAEPPASELTLTLDPPRVTVVESVIVGSGMERGPVASTTAVVERRSQPAEKESQPARIARSVLETPRINAPAVPSPTPSGGTGLKTLLVSHGAGNNNLESGGKESGGKESIADGKTDDQVASAAEMIRQRFPNGKPQVERWVIENTKGNIVNHGKYVEYDARGSVVLSGSYVQGKREGVWTQQTTGEQVQRLLGQRDREFVEPFTSRATFNAGKLDGDWTVVDGKGRLMSSWSYVDGARHGTSSLFNSKGEVTQSITYKNNLADGPARMAEAGGAVKDTTFTEGLMLRQVDKWYPAVAGKPRVLQSQESQLVPMPLNVASSDWANCCITYQSAVATEPIRQGLAVTFYPNGQRESEGNYDRGRRTGTFAWWYSNGQQKTVGEYGGDKEEGEWTWWHENGMKQASGFYADGRRVQEWSLWSNDGKLVKRTTSNNASQVADRDTSEDTLNR